MNLKEGDFKRPNTSGFLYYLVNFIYIGENIKNINEFPSFSWELENGNTYEFVIDKNTNEPYFINYKSIGLLDSNNYVDSFYEKDNILFFKIRGIDEILPFVTKSKLREIRINNILY